MSASNAYVFVLTDLSPREACGEEPCDSEEQPPDGARRQEEVEHHGRHRAPPVVQRPLLDRPLGEEVLGGVVHLCRVRWSSLGFAYGARALFVSAILQSGPNLNLLSGKLDHR